MSHGGGCAYKKTFLVWGVLGESRKFEIVTWRRRISDHYRVP